MPLFNYVAKNKDGKDVRSSVETSSRLEALEFLRKKGLTVIDLVSVDSTGLRAPGVRAPSVERVEPKKLDARETKGRKTISLTSRVKLGDLAVFCRQLAISVTAGLPLRDGLESIGLELEQPALRHAVLDIVRQLNDGRNFSDAAASHPRIFNVMFCGLIRVAEESGKLPQTLQQLAEYMERTDRLQRRIKAMASYPVFIGIFFLLICMVMTLFILPQFSDIFAGFGSKLPPFTQAVFSINSFFVDNFLVIFLVVVLLVTALVLYGRTPDGAYHKDQIKLSAPLAGDLVKKYVMARFCRSLSIMVHSGVPISVALEICGDAAGNKVIQKTIYAVRDRIVTGQRIAQSLAESGVFPGLITRMVSVGEESGQLPEVLERVSDLYEDQVETKIMTTMALFEPLVICIFGGFVMILVMAIYLPIISVSSSVR